MKILKIFGIVVGIHVFALILIFANPGCSSTTKPAPQPSDTVANPSAPPVINAAGSPGSVYSSTTDTSAPAPALTFNPEAPATSGGSRVMPTRPGSPVAGVLVAEPVGDVTPVSSYTVKSGDSLWTIARKNNLTVAQLTGANNLPATASLRPGQKLIIPSKPAAGGTATPVAASSAASTKSEPHATPAPKASTEGIKHTVKSGETLGAIARKYDVRQRDLAVANNISDPGKLKPGMELTIPGWKAPAGGATKSTSKSGASTSKSTPPPVAAPAAEPAPVIEATPAPSQLPPVPVIRIDDAPAVPSPK
ncbi:muramidase family protein [Horticoccus sp. 23ND18S-11]|uniref:muramidase family protein n=1 Tax=Horticoccus sp. 23ND18S-11 TaxID=3391832 RepID=UPI0039C98539